MKILVTGGAGYIGSVTVDALLAEGHEVVVYDNLSQGHRQAVAEDARLVVGDLSDAAAVEDLFRGNPGIEAVMHFASRTLVDQSMREPELYLGGNVCCAVNLISAALRHGAGRFILSSTANLFDGPEEIPIAESAAIRPGSPYGESKYIIERILKWYERIAGLRYACLRYFNAAGASGLRGEDHSPETHIIPLVLGVALGKSPGVTLNGSDYPTADGSCVRDYVHVSDLASAHILVLQALERGSCTYNLGNGRGFSNLEVVATARRATGRSIPVTVGPRRQGDPPVLVASSARIQGELGWQPAMPDLEAIVASAWEWHRRHPDGYGGG